MLTYILIIIIFAILVMIVLYFVQMYVGPKKLDEIQRMIENGQTKLAMKKLNELLEKDDRNAHAHYLLAEAYLKENNSQYAIVEFRQVLKLGRYDDMIVEKEVRSKLANLYLERKAIEEAKKEFLLLTKIDAANYLNFFELGKIYNNQNMSEKAVAFLKKSIMNNARHDQSYYYLGQIYYKNGNVADAKSMFLETIKLDPTNYKAHYFLGLVLRQQGDYDWALKEFEVAQKSEELKVKCFLAKGTCLMDRGQYPKAVMEFERGLKFARRGNETELNLRYFLAECNEKMRDFHAAILNWEKIVEVNSKFRDVQEKLKTYSEFRQDDRIKDFLIAGLAQFEHQSRKMIEIMGYNIMDVDIVSDTEIEIVATESEGKWRNARQTNRLIRILRSTETIQEPFLRRLYESMKVKNATRIIVLTTAEFNRAAVDFANTRPIELYSKSDLIELLRKV